MKTWLNTRKNNYYIMKKYTILPKKVKVLKLCNGRGCYSVNGVDKKVEGTRIIIGKYFVAEHSKTIGLNKGDAFVIDNVYLD